MLGQELAVGMAAAGLAVSSLVLLTSVVSLLISLVLLA